MIMSLSRRSFRNLSLTSNYSLAPTPSSLSIPLPSAFAASLSSLLSIFPLAVFGISLTTLTPPRSHLCLATRGLIHSCTSFSNAAVVAAELSGVVGTT